MNVGSIPARRTNKRTTMTDTARPNTITLNAGADEMLRITPEGFYVRGVLVEQDEKEAQKVYQAFRSWMTWANLTRV